MKLAKTIFYLLSVGLVMSCQHVQGPVYEGVYLDEDNREPNLFVTRRPDGGFDVKMGIFRLTSLDDGVGTLTPEGLSFTATDAGGAPIEALITVGRDTARVTFTKSTWPLLENGATFRYTRQQAGESAR